MDKPVSDLRNRSPGPGAAHKTALQITPPVSVALGRHEWKNKITSISSSSSKYKNVFVVRFKTFLKCSKNCSSFEFVLMRRTDIQLSEKLKTYSLPCNKHLNDEDTEEDEGGTAGVVFEHRQIQGSILRKAEDTYYVSFSVLKWLKCKSMMKQSFILNIKSHPPVLPDLSSETTELSRSLQTCTTAYNTWREVSGHGRRKAGNEGGIWVINSLLLWDLHFRCSVLWLFLEWALGTCCTALCWITPDATTWCNGKEKNLKTWKKTEVIISVHYKQIILLNTTDHYGGS